MDGWMQLKNFQRLILRQSIAIDDDDNDDVDDDGDVPVLNESMITMILYLLFLGLYR